ncbi:unnamed protein product [Clonostachys rosea]|uniref:Uncharacterized protein n=1 Tax=Bionectria ochroleuca TaxID=29856 RepID=A0ABY6UFC9_BIOOC|nr:unnamed protein product [Clonostachys rosea]
MTLKTHQRVCYVTLRVNYAGVSIDSLISEFGDVLQNFANLLTHELCHFCLLPLALCLGHFRRSHLLEKRRGILVVNVHAVAVLVVRSIGIIHLDVVRAVLH